MVQEQPTSAQPAVKKVLVKRVKVLVKRPVAAPAVQTPAAGRTLVKVPVKRPVAAVAQPRPQTPTQAQPTTSSPVLVPQHARTPFAAKPIEPTPQVTESYDDGPVMTYKVPEDILGALDKYGRVTDKLLLLYIYASTYARKSAEEEGYRFPQMLIELPRDLSEVDDLVEQVDDDLLVAMLDDFVEMAPFITGMERIMSNRAPLEQIIQMEIRRIQDQPSLTTAQQIIIAYLSILVDMQMIEEKMKMRAAKKEAREEIKKMRTLDEEERALKDSFVLAIKRKGFPVNARRLVNNYFNFAQKDPDKAYDTLITNPLFFAPLEIERMPRRLFGLFPPSPKDAQAVNKRLALFLKRLKA